MDMLLNLFSGKVYIILIIVIFFLCVIIGFFGDKRLKDKNEIKKLKENSKKENDKIEEVISPAPTVNVQSNSLNIFDSSTFAPNNVAPANPGNLSNQDPASNVTSNIINNNQNVSVNSNTITTSQPTLVNNANLSEQSTNSFVNGQQVSNFNNGNVHADENVNNVF